MELRQAIAVAKGGRRNGQVPGDLRKLALELLAAGRARGTTARDTAAALGIHETTLLSWQRETETRAPFVEARVVADSVAGSNTVHDATPRPIRVMVIDGLGVAAVEALLRSRS
jgi:hypothetical protein